MSTLSHGLQLLKKYYEIMVGDREKIASLTIPPPVISVIFYEESSGSFFSTFDVSFFGATVKIIISNMLVAPGKKEDTYRPMPLLPSKERKVFLRPGNLLLFIYFLGAWPLIR